MAAHDSCGKDLEHLHTQGEEPWQTRQVDRVVRAFFTEVTSALLVVHEDSD